MAQEGRRFVNGQVAPAGLGAEASVTLVLMLLAWLALDDITTDNSTGFHPEYSLLTFCAAWLLVFVFQMWRKSHRLRAGVSLLGLLSAAWVASDGIGHKRDGGWSVFWPEYTVITLTWFWFVGLAMLLVVRAWRATVVGREVSS